MEKGKIYYVVYTPPRTDYVMITPVTYVDELPGKIVIIDALGREITLDKSANIHFYETSEAALEAADLCLEKKK